MKTVHLKITGKVQGVFFRATAREIAEQYNLSGWVKNTSDNAVEATVTGNSEAVDAFIQWTKEGPDRARVENVTVTYLELKQFKSFEVIR